MNPEKFKEMMTAQVRYFQESGVDVNNMSTEEISAMSTTFRAKYEAAKDQDIKPTGTNTSK